MPYAMYIVAQLDLVVSIGIQKIAKADCAFIATNL
jgi:hypothetical protein